MHVGLVYRTAYRQVILGVRKSGGSRASSIFRPGSRCLKSNGRAVCRLLSAWSMVMVMPNSCLLCARMLSSDQLTQTADDNDRR